MEDPNLTIGPGSDVDSTRGSSPAQVRQPVDERLQKLLDKALYGGGHPSAQKIRNFLNGTWLGEPLHVVVKDVPVGAWTVAMVFDALDLVFNRPEFARACETEAQVVIEQWRVQYNTVRPHSSLGYRPPAPKAILPEQEGHGDVENAPRFPHPHTLGGDYGQTSNEALH
jgi:Integrase core domain